MVAPSDLPERVTNVEERFEDLSGVKIKPGENPYNALIDACQGSAVSHSSPARLRNDAGAQKSHCAYRENKTNIARGCHRAVSELVGWDRFPGHRQRCSASCAGDVLNIMPYVKTYCRASIRS